MQSETSDLKIHVYGHPSADPEAVANLFGGQWLQQVESDSDLAIFVIDPSAGIDQKTIDLWAGLDDYLVPRIVVVTHLEKLEADFDDAVMVANRVFEKVITPYLVLHDDAGLPIALIGLADLQIIDYSTSPATKKMSEPEHQTLVQEFRDEYLEAIESSGHDAFAAGLIFPAVPLWIEKGIGVDIVTQYIDQLKK